MRNTVLCFAVVIFGLSLAFGEAKEKILYSFSGSPDAATPISGPLVSDRAGNLFGLTDRGGDQNAGTVFELSPNPDGTWSESVLYSFCPLFSCTTGSDPAGLTVDKDGNLFGTTTTGGILEVTGLVFELSPPSVPGDAWTYTVIHEFCSDLCLDGDHPYGSPTFDGLGNLYGTTSGETGDDNFPGVVYELSLVSGVWNETILYTFCSLDNCADGASPQTGVTFDKVGNLFGTTALGGTGKRDKNGNTGGTLYELSPSPAGWTEKVLVNFPHLAGSPGTQVGPASVDPSGNAYTSFAATYRYPVVDGFIIKAKPNGKMNKFSFTGTGSNTPVDGVIIDSRLRRVYGTLGSDPCGGIFQIDGSGQESLVYPFCQYPGDASWPGSLIQDSLGNLYGATAYGGANAQGTVFEITP